MKNTSTKEKILEAALTLFSEKGYDGVGVDLIAQTVGIKGPSLYKHYKGKEDIFNSILERAENYYNKNFQLEIKPDDVPGSLEELIEFSMKKIDFTIHAPMIKKIRKILSMEQFGAPRIAELTTSHSVDGIVTMYHKIFEVMMEKGLLKPDNPQILAMEFALPVTVFIQICDRQPERETEILELIEQHLRHFTNTYGTRQSV